MSFEVDFHIQYQHENDDQEEDCSNDSHCIGPNSGMITGGCVTGVCGSQNSCGRDWKRDIGES